MEEEQKVDLPLNGELDIKSSDMIVSVNDAKFAHNRQRWQGHCLPSSLRYEHDGWAAGWDVYNFNYNEVTTDVTSTNDVLYKVRRYYYNDNKAYSIAILDTNDTVVASFVYNTETINTIGAQLEYVGKGVYTVTFNVEGQTCTFNYDTCTNSVSDSTDGFIVQAVLNENCKLSLTVKDQAHTTNVHIDKLSLPSSLALRVGKDSTINSNIGVFDALADGVSQWSSTKYQTTLTKNNSIYSLSTKYTTGVNKLAWGNIPVVYDSATGQLIPQGSAGSFTLSGSASVAIRGKDNAASIQKILDVPLTKRDLFAPGIFSAPEVNHWGVEVDNIVVNAWLPMHINIVIKHDADTGEDVFYVYENSSDVTSDYIFTETDDAYIVTTLVGWLGSALNDVSVYIPKSIPYGSNFGYYSYVYFNKDTNTYTTDNDTKLNNVSDLVYTCMRVDPDGKGVILDITKKGYVSCVATAQNTNVSLAANDDLIANRLYIDRDRNNIFTLEVLNDVTAPVSNAFVTQPYTSTSKYFLRSNVDYTLYYYAAQNIAMLYTAFIPDAYNQIQWNESDQTYNKLTGYVVKYDVAVEPEYDELGVIVNNYDPTYKLIGNALFKVLVLNTYKTYVTESTFAATEYINGYTQDILPTICNTLTFALDEASNEVLEDNSVAQKVSISVAGISLQGKIVYTGNQASLTFETQSVSYKGYAQNIYIQGVDAQSTITLNYGMFNITAAIDGSTPVSLLPFSIPYIADESFSVIEANKSTITFSDSINAYTFLYHEGVVLIGSEADSVRANNVSCNNVMNALYRLSFNYTPMITGILTMQGPTALHNMSLDIDDSTLDYIVSLDDDTLVINMDQLLRAEDSTLDFIATDVRDPDLSEMAILKVKQDDEYQIVKQFWDTTIKTEHFWWADSNHVLTLDKFMFTVYEKADTVHDWNGDRWSIVNSVSRVDILQSDIIKYLVTSVYGDESAILLTMRVLSSTDIEINVYDALSMDKVSTFTVSIVQRSLGTALIADTPNTDKLYTYTALRADTLLSQAKVSATRRKNKIIIGIHFDNNFNQWTVISDGTTAVKCIQGYGFVGPDGSLTGGEIPTMYFGEYGFSGIVEDIDTLGNNVDDTEETNYVKSLSEVQNIDSRVYGNDVQQWYVSKNINSIISHIICVEDNDDIQFINKELYINNNYNVVYSSSSFASQVLGDANGIYSTTLFDLLGISGSSVNFASLFNKLENRTGWTHAGGGYNNDVFISEGAPLKKGAERWKNRIGNSRLSDLENFPIYDMRPLLSNINYLQQTIGQYAYVHYNSSSIKVGRNITNAANENGIDQTLTRSYTDMTQLENASLLRENNNKFARPVGSDELAFDTQVIRQVQSCAVEWPRQFLAILSIAMSALDFTSSILQLNKSNAQVAIAGMTNGASQLMSQALNSLALSGLQPQQIVPTQISEVPAIKTLDMFYSTSKAQHVYAGPGFVNHNFVAQCTAQSVTSLQLELKQEKLEWVIKLLTEAETMALACTFRLLQQAVTGLTIIYSNAYIVGTIAAVFAAGIGIVAAKYERRYQSMDGILNALGGDKPKFTVTAALSKHTYDVEGKHKYGNSSKAFMWPCFGCDAQDTYTDEYVSAVTQNKSWRLNTPTSTSEDIDVLNYSTPNDDDPGIDSFVTAQVSSNAFREFNSDIPYHIAMCKGAMYDRQLPDNMAYVIGTESFLSKDAFKNESVGEGDPVFAAPLTQDYMLSARWELGVTATAGEIAWVSVRDTKVMDGEPSNIIIAPDFCGVASGYTAIEVKRGLTKKYMRPVTITPTALALNCTGYNCIFDEKAYHGFDGYGGRIVSFVGAPGMGKEYYTLLYTFLTNDRFKRSNKIAPNQLLGNFKAAPVLAMSVLGDDKVYAQVTMPTENQGMSAGVPGEDKDALRYALPVFSEHVNTLPAATKTLSTYTLAVVEGITSLCTDLRNLLTAYKVPVSIDFNIGQQLYRVTQEYICSLTNEKGAVVIENLVPILGLEFLGASPYEAYFYSQATKLYYVYTGGTSINAVDTVERFRDVQKGYWDFVNQEVVMPCVATFDRLDSHVHDDADETDNVIIPVLKGQVFKGEVPPPVTTIFNTESWYKTYSLPSGIVYQGPNRCIINRFVWSDYMLKSVRDNRGKWTKVCREEYHPFRKYNNHFESVTEPIGTDPSMVKGWTHNPFLLVTSPLGVNEETDCKFEWEVTFAWTVEMDKVYGPDEYACVNIVAETMEPGGKVYSRPSHVYLTKELFTRTGNYGYYSFRYQSGNGIGNRERLHIWADSYIAVSSVQCAYKPMTTRRTEILTQQIDVKGLAEM